jgi:hypothetical protein
MSSYQRTETLGLTETTLPICVDRIRLTKPRQRHQARAVAIRTFKMKESSRRTSIRSQIITPGMSKTFRTGPISEAFNLRYLESWMLNHSLEQLGSKSETKDTEPPKFPI